jgi:hypothetical protein
MPVLAQPVDCTKPVGCAESAAAPRCVVVARAMNVMDSGRRAPWPGAEGPNPRIELRSSLSFAAPCPAGFPSGAMPDIGDNLRRFPLACKSAQSERNRSFRALH